MITFSPILDEHKSKVTEYIQSKNVCKFLSWKPYTDEQSIKEYFEYAQNANDFPDEIMVILLNNQCIGTLHILNKSEGIAQIGFGILPEYWNKGIGVQVCENLLEYIRGSKWSEHTKTIFTKIHKDNIAAIKIAMSNGFSIDPDQSGVKENYIKYTISL